jgi:predicted nucleic acid-binding protein
MMVLDANVAVKTYLEEAGAEAATDLLTGPTKLLAPELIRLEVAGALCRRVRMGELQPGEAEERCQHWLAELDKGLFAMTPDRELLPEAIALSTKLNHPLHDCLYLAVAIRAHAPLVTADRPFYERARPLYKKMSLLKGCEQLKASMQHG